MSTWTVPRTWVVGELATTTLMQEQVRDNFIFIGDSHNHGSSTGSGAGSQAMGPLLAVNISVQSTTLAAVGVMYATTDKLLWNTYNIINKAVTSTLAGLLTLGTSSSEAARGNHTTH